MEVIKKNSQFIAIVFIWILCGYLGPLIYGVIPITIFVLKSRNQYQEMFLGFFFVLIMSDSREDSLQWAVDAKNEYIVLLTLFLLLDRKSFAPLSSFYKKFIPFFIVAFICIAYAPSEIVGISIQKTFSYLFLIIIVSNYGVRCHKDQGREFYKALVYFGSCILIVGFILKYVNNSQAYLEGRFRGLLGNPNGLGIFTLMFFLMFSIINEIYPELFVTREKWVIYISVFLSLFLSNSRNSIFALLIYIFFSYFYKLSPFLGFIFFAMLVMAYQYISDNLVYIIEALRLTRYFRIDTLADASGRYIAWNFAKDHIKDNIWFGRGFEFTNNLFDENSDWLNNLGHQGNAHNTYLTLWLDTGFFGLAAFLWAFLGTFLKAAKKSKLAIPIMYCVVFSTVFESWLTASLNPFTIQLFIILTMLTSEQIIPSQTPAIIPIQRAS